MFINQPGLERILRRRADEVGATVRPGLELVGFTEDADGVTATVRDIDTGVRERHPRQVSGRRRRRPQQGARAARHPARRPRHLLQQHDDLFPCRCLAAARRQAAAASSTSTIPAFGGFFRFAKDCQSGFLGVNTVGDPKADPIAAANAAADISEARLIEIVRSGVGVPDLPVKIDGVTRWRATSDVARSFQRGRVFLVGDAAHLMPPNGGFGGNTGIHDAHNLAWKLAFVLKGAARPELLDSYEAERKPVAKFTVEQAYTRYVTRTATYLGARDYEPLAHDFNIELGYIYHSGAIVAEDDDAKRHDDPRQTLGRPGSRAPHLWVERDGKRCSTLDLFARNYVLLAGPAGSAWCAAAKQAAARFKASHIDAYCVGGPDLADPEGRFCEAYGIAPESACLVRPDGFVAWRAKSGVGDQVAALAKAFKALSLAPL